MFGLGMISLIGPASSPRAARVRAVAWAARVAGCTSSGSSWRTPRARTALTRAGAPRSARPARRTPPGPSARRSSRALERYTGSRPTCASVLPEQYQSRSWPPDPSRGGRTRRSRPGGTSCRRALDIRTSAGSAAASRRPAWSPAGRGPPCSARRCSAQPAPPGKPGRLWKMQAPSTTGSCARRPRPRSSPCAGPPRGAARRPRRARSTAARPASRRPCRRSGRPGCSSRRRAGRRRCPGSRCRRCRSSARSARSGRSGRPARHRPGRGTRPTRGEVQGTLGHGKPRRCNGSRRRRRGNRRPLPGRDGRGHASLRWTHAPRCPRHRLEHGAPAGGRRPPRRRPAAGLLPQDELRLAEHLDETARFDASRRRRADRRSSSEALNVAEDKGVEEMLAFATSAVRDAPNGDEVLAPRAGRDRGRSPGAAGRGRGAADLPGRTPLVRLVRGRLLSSTSAAARWRSPAGRTRSPTRRCPAARRRPAHPATSLQADPPDAEAVRALRKQVRADIARDAGRPAAAAPPDHAVATSKTFRSLARISGAAPVQRGPVRARGPWRAPTQRRGSAELVAMTAAERAELPGVSAGPRPPAPRRRAGRRGGDGPLRRRPSWRSARGRCARASSSPPRLARPRLRATSGALPRLTPCDDGRGTARRRRSACRPRCPAPASPCPPPRSIPSRRRRLRLRRAAGLRRRRGDGRHRRASARRPRRCAQLSDYHEMPVVRVHAPPADHPAGLGHRPVGQARAVARDGAATSAPTWSSCTRRSAGSGSTPRASSTGWRLARRERASRFAVENMYPVAGARSREMQVYLPGWDPVSRGLRQRHDRPVPRRHRRLGRRSRWPSGSATGCATSTWPTAPAPPRTSTWSRAAAPSPAPRSSRRWRSSGFDGHVVLEVITRRRAPSRTRGRPRRGARLRPAAPRLGLA